MVFKFRVVSEEASNFKREIEINAYDTFLDLKNAICESVGYDKNQMCSFFICDDDWEKEKEITMEDMGFDSDQDAYLMEECVLADYLEDEGQKLIFTFDYMTDRSLFMELRDIITNRDLADPVTTLAVGQAPAQTVDLEEFSNKLDEKAKNALSSTELEIEESFYGSDEYDTSEFEAEGFSELEDIR